MNTDNGKSEDRKWESENGNQGALTLAIALCCMDRLAL
jgi:hypothetical protein